MYQQGDEIPPIQSIDIGPLMRVADHEKTLKGWRIGFYLMVGVWLATFVYCVHTIRIYEDMLAVAVAKCSPDRGK